MGYLPLTLSILTNVITRTRVIVAEAVIVQPRLNVLILTLILKRNEGGVIAVLPSFSAEDVKLLLLLYKIRNTYKGRPCIDQGVMELTSLIKLSIRVLSTGSCLSNNSSKSRYKKAICRKLQNEMF